MSLSYFDFQRKWFFQYLVFSSLSSSFLLLICKSQIDMEILPFCKDKSEGEKGREKKRWQMIVLYAFFSTENDERKSELTNLTHCIIKYSDCRILIAVKLRTTSLNHVSQYFGPGWLVVWGLKLFLALQHCLQENYFTYVFLQSIL